MQRSLPPVELIGGSENLIMLFFVVLRAKRQDKVCHCGSAAAGLDMRDTMIAMPPMTMAQPARLGRKVVRRRKRGGEGGDSGGEPEES